MLSKHRPSFLILFLCLLLLVSSKASGCGIKTTGNVSHGCTPFLVHFIPDTSGSSKTIAQFKWSFGNGDSSNQTTPSYVYKLRGSYKVSLEIIYTDGTTCSASYPAINIYGLPTAGINIPKNIECFPGNSFSFKSQSTVSPDSFPLTGYVWNFGDGKDTLSQSPSHHYDSAGIYNINLTIKDSKGCVNSTQINSAIRVINPIAFFTIDDSIGCDSAPIHFNNLSDTANSFIGQFY